jgi:hypothetical protein
MGLQRVNHISVAVQNGHIQRRAAIVTSQIHGCATFQQQANNIKVTTTTRPIQ